MHKKAFLACMLVVTMLLTGCTLIEKDEAVDRATEVVRVSNSAGGEDIVYTKGEVLDEVNYQLNYMSYLYSMLGYSYDPTDPTIIAQTKDDVMDMLVEDAVETLKAQELGLTVTDYLCLCGLGKEIVRVDGLDKVLSELKAQGRNLNQLTTLANMGKITVVYGDRLAEGYGQVSEQLRQLLREVT